MENHRVSIALKIYRRPFRVPVRASRGLWEAREGILLRAERDDGRAGFGEIAPIESFGSESLAAALAWCTGVSVCAESELLASVPRRLPCCRAAVAAALEGMVDVAEKPAPAAADAGAALDVAALLPTGAGATAAMERSAGDGFAVFKVKIGAAHFVAERAMIERLAEQLPPGGRLRLDANGGLDARGAIRWLDAAQAWPVEFIEQPLPPDAVRDLVALARDHTVPVALDEAVRGADDIKRWRDHDWPGLFVIKPALAGDPGEWMREVMLGPGSFVFSSALETAIGAAAGLRLAFRSGSRRALGFGVGGFFEDDGFGGGVATPRLSAADIATIGLEAVWNRL